MPCIRPATAGGMQGTAETGPAATEGGATTRDNGTGMIPIRDPLLVVLELMQASAIRVLNEHSDEAGLCAVCGSVWPCEPVVLATHNLADLT